MSPHALIEVLTDRPARCPLDRCHELHQDNRLKFDLSDLQLTGEDALQRRLADMRTTTIADVAANQYVAELVGANTDSEWAMRWLILLMVLTCDPLAIALTAAASARKG